MKQRSRFKTLRAYVESQTRGKTQGDVARELEIAQSTLSSYLSGVRIPNLEIAKRLSERTGVPLKNLLYPSDVASV